MNVQVKPQCKARVVSKAGWKIPRGVLVGGEEVPVRQRVGNFALLDLSKHERFSSDAWVEINDSVFLTP